MVDGVDQIDDESGVAETALGGREFRGAVEHRDPMAPELKPAPEGVPEKFWDPIKGELRQDDLLKSYSELEKKIGAPKDDEPKDDEPKDDEPKDDEPKDDEPKDDEPKDDEPKDDEPKDDEDPFEGLKAELGSSVETAQAEYAETGELSEDTRTALAEKLAAVGLSPDYIDFHLQGVKATEAALMSAATQAAGSDEDLQAAMQWAAQGGLSKKQILAFNAQMGDVETVGPAVAGLMTAFRAAEPGEGRLTNKTTGHSTGDVYGHMDEFTADLGRADKTRDKVARRKAIEKLRRSRAAGTIKSERRSPFGG